MVFINEGVYFQPNFRQTLIDVLHPQMESFNFDSDVLDLLYFQKFFDVFKSTNFNYNTQLLSDVLISTALSAMDTIAITASILFRGFIWPFGTQLADSDANIGPFQISAGGTEIKKFTETIDYYNFTEMPGIGAKAVEIPLKVSGKLMNMFSAILILIR